MLLTTVENHMTKLPLPGPCCNRGQSKVLNIKCNCPSVINSIFKKKSYLQSPLSNTRGQNISTQIWTRTRWHELPPPHNLHLGYVAYPIIYICRLQRAGLTKQLHNLLIISENEYIQIFYLKLITKICQHPPTHLQ